MNLSSLKNEEYATMNYVMGAMSLLLTFPAIAFFRKYKSDTKKKVYSNPDSIQDFTSEEIKED